MNYFGGAHVPNLGLKVFLARGQDWPGVGEGALRPRSAPTAPWTTPTTYPGSGLGKGLLYYTFTDTANHDREYGFTNCIQITVHLVQPGIRLSLYDSGLGFRQPTG